MSHTACAHCNAARTTSNPLKSCSSCLSVSYCDRACQKAHWKTHKTACNFTNEKRGFPDKDGNIIFKDKIVPSGAFIERRIPPSDEFPRGYSEMVTLGPELAAMRAQMTAEERVQFDGTILEGMKAGYFQEKDYLEAQAAKKAAAAMEPEDDDLQKKTAAKFQAAKERSKLINQLRIEFDDGTYAARVENGKVVVQSLDGRKQMLPEDSYAFVDVAPCQQFPNGYKEIIAVNADNVLEMKDMSAEAKEALKTRLVEAYLAKV